MSHSALCLRVECWSRHSVGCWHCESHALSLEHTTRAHGPWIRPVSTGVREHGCRFWTPVNTAIVNTYDTPATNTAREHRALYLRWRYCMTTNWWSRKWILRGGARSLGLDGPQIHEVWVAVWSHHPDIVAGSARLPQVPQDPRIPAPRHRCE